jgi:protein-S-isoprenylcysteine O-methyltransferase Ste14
MTTREQRLSKVYAVGQTVLLLAFAAVFLFAPGRRLFPPGMPGVVGLVLCAAGLLLMLLGLASIRGNVQIEPEPRAGAHLVTTGAYRYLRHPIYTAIVVLVIGLFLRRPTLRIGLMGVLVIAFLAVKVRFEERRLQATYPEYREYRTRSWGLIPGLRW